MSRRYSDDAQPWVDQPKVGTDAAAEVEALREEQMRWFKGELAGPCGRFYRSTEGRSAFEYADILRVMDVLLNDIQVDAVFSDFPLTSAAFANCLSR